MSSNNAFGIKMTIVDHRKEALEELEEALTDALTECGIVAERTAKEHCPVAQPWNWHPPRTDYIGGTLRNSIAYALDGKVPTTGDIRGSGLSRTYYDNEGNKKGTYSGATPKETRQGFRALYIGTNVYYAPYVEMGTTKMAARPFIRPALVENRQEFYEILKKHLKGTAGLVSI